MSKADRVRACYLHASLCYVMRREMTNTTLRQRFGIAEKRIDASRLLNEAVEFGFIVVACLVLAPIRSPIGTHGVVMTDPSEAGRDLFQP